MTLMLESNLGELQRQLHAARAAGRKIGFVPTMGYLHAGHQSLIEMAAANGDYTVVSIFVNPTQFGPNEDLDSYPRDPEGDMRRCREAGADLVFFPSREDLYPARAETMVTPGELAQRLCGLSRPAFFGGICTVVLKFFNLVRPDRAYFGEKDFQQLTIIRRMVTDLFLDVEVVGGATVREADGLAMSSRNVRLKPEQRALALTLWRTIGSAREAYQAGERNAIALREQLLGLWPEGITFDYLDFREPEGLALVDELAPGVRIFLGVWIDGVRLIDNAAIA